eukprot:gene4048-39215_t
MTATARQLTRHSCPHCELGVTALTPDNKMDGSAD